ncbi:MAG: hypothetical protein ACOYOV_06440 [Bacteroidales bacterium]
MKTTKKIMTIVLLIAMTVTVLSFDLPKAWLKAGDKPNSYDMGIDKGAGQNGTNAATIQSRDKKIDGFGTLMQNCLPVNYLGKRIKMSGFLKTKDVAEWSGFWLRIDQKGSDETLGFDNMHDGKKDRSIKGTTDWTKYEIVLDVPLKTTNIAFGALLVGTGQIWFDNLKFEVVDNTIPTTGSGSESAMPLKEPTNLDFDK